MVSSFVRIHRPLLTNLDSHTSSRDPSSVVTSAAYLLFYRRRSEHPLGGPKLEALLTEAEGEANSEVQGSREPSPSGEGRRLGDSSHNGLSSASGVDQAHLVGVGGSASQNLRQGLHPEDADQARLQEAIEATEDDPAGFYHSFQSQDDRMLLDDEGIAMDGSEYPSYGPQIEPEWGFTMLSRQPAAPPGSDADGEEDLFSGQAGASSTSSTRVDQGDHNTSPPGSLPDYDHDQDAMMYSEPVMADEDNRQRSRESAPPPLAYDIDEDDLPVAELKAAEDGELQFSTAKGS